MNRREEIRRNMEELGKETGEMDEKTLLIYRNMELMYRNMETMDRNMEAMTKAFEAMGVQNRNMEMVIAGNEKRTAEITKKYNERITEICVRLYDMLKGLYPEETEEGLTGKTAEIFGGSSKRVREILEAER